jgi:diguanylate cyclase
MNNIRRNSLADLLEKNLISHYESHLIWLSDLARHIQNQDKTAFPELDSTMCAFGQWIHGDAKKSIKNNSKYESIFSIHQNLHLFARKIFNILRKDEYHILITYLEKCELISLNIGTELALLDQIAMNKKITKDVLTGALNRNGLKDIFENQYELSLATSNPFVLAMCDLDFFKNINDKYGHVAGDRVLKMFVDVVKKNVRNSDVIIRYGGEEFMIILPSINRAKGLEVLEKVRRSFGETSLVFNETTILATVSMGMVEVKPELPYKQAFLDEYVMIADRRLYVAKESGRDKIEYS